MRSRRAGFTLVEVLVVLVLLGMLISVAVYLFGFGGRATRRLTPRLSLQQAGRKALVAFLREIQEGMEVVTPRPGSTLSYALIRDKLARFRLYYQIASGPGSYALWRYTEDPALAVGQRKELLFSNIQRLTFTSHSEGALQINLELQEDEERYSLVTSVRLRNLASAEELW